MSKTLIVAWREFVETVKTKAFVFGAIIFPFIMIAFIFFTEKLMRAGAEKEAPLRRIAVLDQTGGAIFVRLDETARAENATPDGKARPIEFVRAESSAAELRDAVNRGDYYAALVLEPGLLEPRPDPMPDRAEFTRRDSQIEMSRRIERIVKEAVIAERFARSDPPVDHDRVRALERDVDLTEVDAKSGERSEGRSLPRIMAPFAFMFLLWMGTFGISQGLLTSVIEEKSSRVVEVLLSAVSPLQLMAGKILGMVLVGMVLVGAWVAVGLTSARSANMTSIVSTDRIAYFVMYFIPAFLLFAALLASIGAAFNTLKEAQAMVSPLTLFTTIPMMLWFVISEHPNGALAVALSFFPPVTPFIMMLRLGSAAQIPMWQIVATQVVLWLSVVAAIWVAAKVFRVGILMYGKAPTLGELAKWLRQA